MDPKNSGIAYTVSDAFYVSSRIFELDISTIPAQIRRSILIKDTLGILTAEDPSLVKGDADISVNIDPEGITNAAAGGFWIAAEGKGDRDGTNPPFKSENYLLQVSANGVIQQLVALPKNVAVRQLDDGFEGIASAMLGNIEVLYVAFQSEWTGDSKNFVRIGRYNTANGEWKFFNSKLDPEPLISIWKSLSLVDYREILPKISVPTLLVHGDESQFYSVELAQYVRDSIPDAQLHIYEGSDHSPHSWQKERFIEDLRTFTQA